MNALTFAGAAPQTMTSREMAELTEKRHDSVKRTIETLAKNGVIDEPQSVEYLDGLGRPAQEYLIGKRNSYIVVAQLSPQFTARLVDRWQELEANAPARVMSPGEMFLQNAQAMVAMEKTIAEQGNQIANQAEAIKRIESKQSAYDNGASFFTVIGFGVHRGISFGLTDAAALGRAAAKLSKENGIAVDKVKDPRFGSVNSYHESMLDAALTKIHGGM